MDRREMLGGLAAIATLLAGQKARGEDAATCFELRVYHTNEGKLDDLLARFRNHTVALFKRHGIASVGYWVPEEGPLKGRTLFYLLKYPSRADATAMWQAFRTDPEWVAVQGKSEENGKLVDHVESTFLELTEFSPKVEATPSS